MDIHLIRVPQCKCQVKASGMRKTSRIFVSQCWQLCSHFLSLSFSREPPPPLAEYSMWPIKAEYLSTFDAKLLSELRPWPAHDISTRLFFRATFAAFRAKTASDLTRASTYPSSAFDCTGFRICNSRQNLYNAFHQPSRGVSQTISHSRGGRACGRCHAWLAPG